MIMSMCNIIAITNRRLCSGNFMQQIERLATSPVKAILLREKDLNPVEYRELAEAVLKICRQHNKECILHGNYSLAAELRIPLHLPLDKLRGHSGQPKALVKLGVSVHSLDDAAAAVQLGANYLIAGHIFATECKRGLAPRGLDFLRQICAAVPLPVYAVGGITLARLPSVMAQGAAGGCMMSDCMKADSELFTVKLPTV